MPGAELTEDLGDDKYRGKVAIRMGPVKLQFAGNAEIKERDEAAKRIVVDAAGSDERGRGQAAMAATASLAAVGGGTRVDVSLDLQLSGAARMQARITGGAAAAAPAAASGFGIAMRAMRLALARVLRRFFLPYQPTTS